MRQTLSLLILAAFLIPGGVAHAEEVLGWKGCVDEAKKRHPSLIAAFDKVDQAVASKEITRSVLLPQITGAASEKTVKAASTTNAAPISYRKRVPTTMSYGISAQQLLFDGFKSSYDLSGAERSIWSARYNYNVTSSNIRLQLRTAFVNLLGAQELVNVTEEIETRRRQTLELVRLRYEGGREHKGSLLTSEADLAAAIFNVDQAKRSIYVAQRQLTKELGRSIFLPMTAQGDLAVVDEVRDRPNFERIAATTPFLQQLIAQKEVARFGVQSAYANLFPQVYASGNAGNTGTRWFPDKNEWSVGTTATLPLFDGGNRIAAISKAKATLGQATEDERSGRDSVIYTLSNTWTQLQDALDKVGVQLKILEATKERSRIATAEYAIGLMSYDNWIIIENNLVAAKINYLNAQTGAMIAEATWIQAKGGTLEYDQE